MLTAKDLTAGERVYLERRRHGWTKAAAAEWWNVSLYRLERWELDAESDAGPGVPRVSVGRLTEAEAVHILRRRAGISAAAMAELLGVSRWWLCRMESGTAPADRLADYWRARAGAASRAAAAREGAARGLEARRSTRGRARTQHASS